MELNVKEAGQKIENYFAKVTREQLHKDLVESGLGVYCGDEFNFLDELSLIVETRRKSMVILKDEANSIDYRQKKLSVEKETHFVAEIIRPVYPLRERAIESSNQESNLSRILALESSSEDSLFGGEVYGYI